MKKTQFLVVKDVFMNHFYIFGSILFSYMGIIFIMAGIIIGGRG